MTPEKKAKQIAKRVSRTQVNRVMKGLKGDQNRRILANQGQMCTQLERYAHEQGDSISNPVDYDQVFDPQPPTQPNVNRLVWLNGKTYKQNLGDRKNRPSNKTDNLTAFAENAARDFAKQVEIALNPPVVAPEA